MSYAREITTLALVGSLVAGVGCKNAEIEYPRPKRLPAGDTGRVVAQCRRDVNERQINVHLATVHRFRWARPKEDDVAQPAYESRDPLASVRIVFTIGDANGTRLSSGTAMSDRFGIAALDDDIAAAVVEVSLPDGRRAVLPVIERHRAARGAASWVDLRAAPQYDFDDKVTTTPPPDDTSQADHEAASGQPAVEDSPTGPDPRDEVNVVEDDTPPQGS